MAKKKKVSYTLIPEKSDVGALMYARLYELINLHHEHLTNARIALAWCKSWKPDVDGRVTLGKCKKATDLDREFTPYDFVILLSKDFWENIRVTEVQRTALLDHELCHAAVAYDDTGEPKRDERDRVVYRIRKHDLEEFADIAARYGCWKRDLEYFASALKRGTTNPLLDVADEAVEVDEEKVTCTMQAMQDGKPVGEPVDVTEAIATASRRRRREQTAH